MLRPWLITASLLMPALAAAPAHANGFGQSRLWSSSFSPSPEKPMVGDFNGDGRDDVISFVGDAYADGRRGDVMVALSTGSSLAAPVRWHDFFCLGAEVPVVGDFNGDGRDDIGLFKRSAAGGQAGDVLVALSTGNGFGASGLWHPFFGLGDELPAVGDFNGDGRDDVAVFKRTSPGTQAGDVLVALSTGAGFGGSQLWHDAVAFGAEHPAIGDFDGDGADDVVVFKLSATPGLEGQVMVARSNRNGFAAPALWHWFFGIGAEVPVVGDVDGDGADDIAVFKRSTTGDVGMGDVLVARSNRWWFGGSEVWHDFFGVDGEIPALGDLDHDGRDDALVFKRTGFGRFARGQVLAAVNAEPSVQEPESRGVDFGFDTLRSRDGARALGERPLLAILIDFSDETFAPDRTAAFYRDHLFAGIDNFRTLTGFFREASAGLFTFTEAGVVGPFTAVDSPLTPADESRRECAKGNTKVCEGTNSDEASMFRRAILRASWGGVDFKRYDRNNDGLVTIGELGLMMINASGDGDGSATFFGSPGCQAVTGASGPVQVCPELVSIAEFTSFSNMVHEMAHTLGTHDLYGSADGMGTGATVMAGPAASTDSRPSVELDAWHKIALGWVTPRVYDLTQPGSCEYLQVTLADEFHESSSYFDRPIVIYDPRRGGREFFVLEYRLKDSWFNRYDADVTETGLAVWYVQLDANREVLYIPGVHIHPGDDGTLQSTAAAGSDDWVRGSTLRSGPDETWQSAPAGDDGFYWDRALFELPVGEDRGTTEHYRQDDGQFRLRYLLPWEDAELALEVTSPDPRWMAVRWGHHGLDVRSTGLPGTLVQSCHSQFGW